MRIVWVQRECNWLQALEGDIDTSHFGFLHDGSLAPEDLGETIRHFTLINRAPDYHLADTRLGHDATRAIAPPTPAVPIGASRISSFRSGRMIPAGELRPAHRRARLGPDGRHAHHVRAFLLEGNGRPCPRAMTAASRPPRLRHRLSAEHDRLVWTLAAGRDRGRRLAHRPRACSAAPALPGIDGIHLQDQAVTESMGRSSIAARASRDQRPMITRTRRRLLQAARAWPIPGRRRRRRRSRDLPWRP